MKLTHKTKYRAAYYRIYLKLKKKRYAARTEPMRGVSYEILDIAAYRALHLSNMYTIDELITYRLYSSYHEKAD